MTLVQGTKRIVHIIIVPAFALHDGDIDGVHAPSHARHDTNHTHPSPNLDNPPCLSKFSLDSSSSVCSNP